MIPEKVADADELPDLRHIGGRWQVPDSLQLVESGNDALICEAES